MRAVPMLVAGLVLACGSAAAVDLTTIERTIGAEPDYRSGAPRYCLLAFGAEADLRVWLVLDDDALYIDRNADGDLTDEGERCRPRLWISWFLDRETTGRGTRGDLKWPCSVEIQSGPKGDIAMRRQAGSLFFRLAVMLVVAGPCAKGASVMASESGPEEILSEASQAAKKGELRTAFSLVEGATEEYPDHVPAWEMLAELHSALGRHRAAVGALGKVLALAPDRASAYNRRGAEYFKAGQIEESIADFDKYIELVPDAEAGHWMRGISYYYAGRYAEGSKQFEGYQTVDSNDVENAVWRYLCMARDKGVEEAQAEILKIGNDARVPMMEVYALYRGTAEPDDVLTAARAGEPGDEQLNERLFYAHLYLGLYHEAAGDEAKALQHMALAADEHKIGHYMWHVARVHAKRIREPEENEE